MMTSMATERGNSFLMLANMAATRPWSSTRPV
jgi:hypothetical protein